jgi:hypothetical protein
MPRRQASVSKVPIILARKAGMSGHGGRRHFVAWERKGGRQDRGSSRRAVPLGPAMRSILRGERSLNSIQLMEKSSKSLTPCIVKGIRPRLDSRRSPVTTTFGCYRNG